MALIALAGKSYKLEHNSRKMSRKVLVVLALVIINSDAKWELGG
jgi:hypothetical protein